MASTNFVNGKRKTSVARVRLSAGEGVITVNGKDYKEYFKRKAVAANVVKPLEVTETLGKYNIIVNVNGGGLSGQAGAVRFAIARALRAEDERFRLPLRRAGYLTRDARIVERKMYGHKKARRSFQFSKR